MSKHTPGILRTCGNSKCSCNLLWAENGDTIGTWYGDDDLVTQAADYIERLEAVVIALDDAMRYATVEEINAVLDVNRGRVWSKLVATRHRVTLPPLTQTNQAKDGDKEDASNGK